MITIWLKFTKLIKFGSVTQVYNNILSKCPCQLCSRANSPFVMYRDKSAVYIAISYLCITSYDYCFIVTL